MDAAYLRVVLFLCSQHLGTTCLCGSSLADDVRAPPTHPGMAIGPNISDQQGYLGPTMKREGLEEAQSEIIGFRRNDWLNVRLQGLVPGMVPGELSVTTTIPIHHSTASYTRMYK